MSDDYKQLDEVGEAVRRAGSVVTDHIDSIVAAAERRAQQSREDATGEAKLANRESLDSASEAFERIQALERPLPELVQSLRVEVARVGEELEGASPQWSPAVEEAATGDTALEGAQPAEAPVDDAVEPDPPVVDSAEPAPPPVREHSKREPKPEPSPARRREPQPVMVPSRPAHEGQKGKRGLFSRLRGEGGKSVFIDSPGYCAVCQETFMAGSKEGLALSAWRVNGDVGLCPDCQANGWQLPDGARLPVRRRGA